MATAIRIWEALLWIFGAVFVLPVVVFLWREPSQSEWRQATATVLFGLYLLAWALGVVSAFGMKRATRWARPVGWIVASLQTLAIPFFTPLGIFGLILLFRGAGKPGTLPASARASRSTANATRIVIEMVVLGLALDGFFRWARRLGYPDMSSLPAALVTLWACIVVQLVIHEAGHALAVKLVHGHIHRFQIGPLRWRREAGRTWMEFVRKFSSAGSVAWTPGSVRQLARQRLLVSAGGTFANVVCASIALALFPRLSSLGAPRSWPWAMFMAFSGVALLSNLWPGRKGYRSNDGAVIHALLANADSRRLCEVTLFQGMSDSSELRPREWPRADLEWTLTLEDVEPFASHQSAILHAACAHYLDAGDTSEAVRCARRFHDLAREQPKRCSPDGFPEAAFTLAFYGGDPEAASDLWARRPAGAQAQFELAERLASAAIANDDREAAIRRAWECSDLYGSCGTIEYLRGQLRRLETGSLASISTRPLRRV
jgi:hypothetical protein